jgi:peptidoglycan/LPS O-acetylase OafA/YrhL
MDATAATSTAGRSERFVILDGLRGVAALAVASFHAFLGFDAAQGFEPHGQLGVDFFFS